MPPSADTENTGVQGIYVVTVNDAFVTQAWKEKLGAKDAKLVHILADDSGAVCSHRER